MSDIEVTVGICAYNEAQIIGKSIESIYAQKLSGISVKEVIVVSSGSDDGTDDIVMDLAGTHPNLRLIRQERREGKNSAINCYLDSKTCDIVVMLNADNVFGSDEFLQKLVEPFRDPQVGITGGRPVPTNPMDDRVGYGVHMVWSLHHSLAKIYPKIGELIAFRDIGTRLSTDMQSDEDIIRMGLERAGYRCVYVPDSIILNHGPETLGDFEKQRLRVNIGECTMKKMYDYDIPTWNRKYLAKAMFRLLRELPPHPIWLVQNIMLELRCRRQARKHVAEGGDNMSVWDRIDSTKKLQSGRPRRFPRPDHPGEVPH